MRLTRLIPKAAGSVDAAIAALRAEANNLNNLRGTSADERLSSYHAWAAQAGDQLGSFFDLQQVAWLIATHRHDILIARATGYNEVLVNRLITAEQTDRGRVFTETIEALVALHARCQDLPTTVLLPDTNVYVHQDSYFDEVDWGGLARTSHPLRLLVPMAVIRELDRHKRAPGNKVVSESNGELVRTRARVTSRRLRALFAGDPDAVPSIARGISIELILDPLRHAALPDADSEIIDRALALQVLAGRQIQVMTGDGNMEFAARIAGLGVMPLPD